MEGEWQQGSLPVHAEQAHKARCILACSSACPCRDVHEHFPFVLEHFCSCRWSQESCVLARQKLSSILPMCCRITWR